MHEALTPEQLLAAYANGIFPMAEHQTDEGVFWVDPRRRGVLPLDGFHISRSLSKRLRKGDYSISYNRAFDEVVGGCADRPETWINPLLYGLYADLHRMGFAHSIEVWDQDDSLIGGVFGLAIGGAFFGESMFSRAPDGSKIALAYLVDHLRACGFSLFDTQFTTPHLNSLGGQEIARANYRKLLAEALQQKADFDARPAPQTPQDVLQRNAQTS